MLSARSYGGGRHSAELSWILTGCFAVQTTGADEATWWLRDINMEVKQGQLVCIVGRVGSGKSSLLSALLGEMQVRPLSWHCCLIHKLALGSCLDFSAITDSHRHRGCVVQCASGRVAVGGSMAYVAQQAWIINDTVENNVLLGQELDQARWDRVVKARFKRHLSFHLPLMGCYRCRIACFSRRPWGGFPCTRKGIMSVMVFVILLYAGLLPGS